MTLALPARAKLNLELEVLGRNADGFHDLRTVFQAIELHDVIELEQAPQTSITTSGIAIDQMDNSVLKAHRALELAVGRALPTRIHIYKRIPLGSGMGGASSDAATALRGFVAIHRIEVDLTQVARDVGADVPFFLFGGCARGEGRGERLTPLPVTASWFALAWPGIELLTADVYGAWDEVKGEGPNHLRRAAEHVEPRLKHFAQGLGDGWQMTGSGSAFFKKVENEDEGRKSVENLDWAGHAQGASLWTSVTRAVGRWA